MMITAEMTIDAAVQKFPETIKVFTAAGLDTCCGGSLSIQTAAEKHNLSVVRLLDDLNAASGGENQSCCTLCFM